MNSTHNNFFKTNKTKQNNLFIPEGIKPLNLESFRGGKTSCSPMRNTGFCDIFKKTKFTNNVKLPVMNSYNNNNPYKLMDVVIKILILFRIN